MWVRDEVTKKTEAAAPPAWKAKKYAALTAWRASLSAAELEAYEQAKVNAKAAAAARRAARKLEELRRQDFDRLVVSYVLLGLSTAEIADRLSVSQRHARRLCQRLGFDPVAPGYRRVSACRIKHGALSEIAAIGSELGLSSRETVERLLTYTLEDCGFRARRILRA